MVLLQFLFFFTKITELFSEIPSFTQPMKNDDVEEHTTAVISCMAKGSPLPRLEWQKDDKPLEPNLTERHFFTKDDQLLIIVDAKVEDSGKYTCKMMNTLGSVSDSMELTVRPRGGISSAAASFFQDSTTTGIIIIAVVCCVVGTSLIWVVIIYQTRRKNEEYSSTPTEETTIPEVAYNSSEPNGYTRTIYTAQGPYSKVYANGGTLIKNGSGLHVNGGFNITHNPMENDNWDGGLSAVSVGMMTGNGDQNSREPLVSTSSTSSGTYPYQSAQYHQQPYDHQIQHIDSQRTGGSSISIASSSSSSSCSDIQSSPGTQSSTVALTTFQPYPLGRPENCSTDNDLNSNNTASTGGATGVSPSCSESDDPGGNDTAPRG